MYMSDYTVQLLHDERLRDAEQRRSQLNLIRDASEQVPNEYQSGLMAQIKQWMQSRTVRHEQQEIRDARPVHAQ